VKNDNKEDGREGQALREPAFGGERREDATINKHAGRRPTQEHDSPSEAPQSCQTHVSKAGEEVGTTDRIVGGGEVREDEPGGMADVAEVLEEAQPE
jgi:hypothetical protein